MASEPLLRVEGIHLGFKGVKALDNVSLAVPDGSLFAVIGPNGAGKSSLFNCISGLYRPDRGSVRFAGQELVGLAPHRIAGLGIARTFQNLGLFQHLTVLENLLLGRHTHYRSHWWSDLFWTRRTRAEELRHRERVEHIIDFLELERQRSLPVGILPYGLRKRIELGRALCMEPRLLLLDEPAAGLNQEERELLAGYLIDIQGELGITQILVEHELGLVLDLAEHVAVLDFGKKIAEGSPAEVRVNPAVIEAYIGGVPSHPDPEPEPESEPEPEIEREALR
jgi:branched-chain amino acid transport system ATP-binding protein